MNEKLPDLVESIDSRFELVELLSISSVQNRGSHCSEGDRRIIWKQKVRVVEKVCLYI